VGGFGGYEYCYGCDCYHSLSLGRAVAIFWDVVAGEELCLDFRSELIIKIQKVGLLCAYLFHYHTVKADHAQINIERASRPPGQFLSVKEQCAPELSPSFYSHHPK
jgi:hypothetical protein